MARTSNLTDFLTDVSSAIKQKTGDSAPIPASEFDTEILSIETAGNYQSKTLNITQNGNYNLLPDQEFDAISNVNISVSVSPVLQNKTITENGSYTADQNYDGLGTVIVNVPSTGIDTSDATATSSDIVSGKVAYNASGKVTGSVLERASTTGGQYIIDDTMTESSYNNKDYVVALRQDIDIQQDTLVRAGSTWDIWVNQSAIANAIGLTPEKIKKGETILGITGTYEPDYTELGTISPTEYDTAVSTSEDILGTTNNNTSGGIDIDGEEVEPPIAEGGDEGDLFE